MKQLICSFILILIIPALSIADLNNCEPKPPFLDPDQFRCANAVFFYDWENSSEEFNESGSASVSIKTGEYPPKGELVWTVDNPNVIFSNGKQSITGGKSQILRAGDETCGYVSIIVTDECGNQATGGIRAKGKWILSDSLDSPCGYGEPNLDGAISAGGPRWQRRYLYVHDNLKVIEELGMVQGSNLPNSCSCPEKDCEKFTTTALPYINKNYSTDMNQHRPRTCFTGLTPGILWNDYTGESDLCGYRYGASCGECGKVNRLKGYYQVAIRTMYRWVYTWSCP